MSPFSPTDSRIWLDTINPPALRDPQPRATWLHPWRKLRAALRREAIRAELYRLSDRELADIGLTRGTISQVLRE